MNADFEIELNAPAGSKYRRAASFDTINRRLASHLLWLASPGDALLVEKPLTNALITEAAHHNVELVSLDKSARQDSHDDAARIFTPWGWTASAAAIGKRFGARVEHAVALETVRRVNSKLWSHALEQELGLALPFSQTATSFNELHAAVARACPQPNDKWVIKSPSGFAARERVLGRGPALEGPPATWAKKRLLSGETLIFQLWLEVLREYGTVMTIKPGGEIKIHGISDLQTNGAGTGTGYMLGRPPAPPRIVELERIATIVGKRLWQEGYTGPAGVDALEHTGGLHPLLEVNARYTMGFVALAVERALKPVSPIFWSTK